MMARPTRYRTPQQLAVVADDLLAPDILFLFKTIGSGRGQSESRCAADMILSSLSKPERQALLIVYRSVATSATDIAASHFDGDA